MTHSPTMDFKSGTMLLALAAVWGGSFFFAELALTEVPPLTIALHRVFWAVPLLLLVLRFMGLHLPAFGPIWGSYLVMGALNNALPFSLIFWGQSQIDSGLASILNATTGIFGAVIAGLMLADEPLLRRKLMGAAIGLLGVAVIMGRDAISGINVTNLAQMAILGAAISYSFAGVWGKTHLSGQPPLVNATGMLIGSTVLMIPIVWVFDGPPALALTPITWAALFGLASLSTVLAYALYFAILTRAGAANLMLVTLLIPPFAIALGSAFLGEVVPPTMWFGFAIICLGFAVTDGRLLKHVLGRFE